MSLSDEPPNQVNRPTTTTMISLGDIEEEEQLHISSSVSTHSSDEDEQRILSRCGRGSLAGFGSRSANGFKAFASSQQITRNDVPQQQPKSNMSSRTHSTVASSINTPRRVSFSDVVAEGTMCETDPPLPISRKRSSINLTENILSTLSRAQSGLRRRNSGSASLSSTGERGWGEELRHDESRASLKTRERLPFGNVSPRQISKPFAPKTQPESNQGSGVERRPVTLAAGYVNGLARKSSNSAIIDCPSGRFSGGPKSTEGAENAPPHSGRAMYNVFI